MWCDMTATNDQIKGKGSSHELCFQYFSSFLGEKKKKKPPFSSVQYNAIHKQNYILVHWIMGKKSDKK